MSVFGVGLGKSCAMTRMQLLKRQSGRACQIAKITVRDARQQQVLSSRSNSNRPGASSRAHRSWEWQALAGLGELTWLVCVAHCIVEYVAEPYTVAGPSMEPTIRHMSVVAVDKMRGRSDSLKLGNIVVAQSPPEPGRMVVKRVVGLPGDIVQVRPLLWDVRNSIEVERRLEVVPEGHVWLEGDNKNNSTDSRNYGAVPQALVEGVVFLRIWPFGDAGLM